MKKRSTSTTSVSSFDINSQHIQQEQERMTQSRYDQARRRRRALLKQLPRHGIAVLSAAPTRIRSHDTDYPYRQDSDFYYLTGFVEENAVLVLIPGRAEGEVVLFCQPKDKTRELWSGILTGPAQARDLLQVDEAHSIG